MNLLSRFVWETETLHQRKKNVYKEIQILARKSLREFISYFIGKGFGLLVVYANQARVWYLLSQQNTIMKRNLDRLTSEPYEYLFLSF